MLRFCASPDLDPASALAGELLFYGTDARSGGTECVFSVADASGRVMRTVAVPLQRPALMHDFAVTERHAVFLEGSLVMDPSVRDCVGCYCAGMRARTLCRLLSFRNQTTQPTAAVYHLQCSFGAGPNVHSAGTYSECLALGVNLPLLCGAR